MLCLTKIKDISKMKLSANHTVAACFTGAMVQAFVINFPPLLYTTFERNFGISLSKISLLIAISFITQLMMDLVASKIPCVFNKRATVVISQLCSATGLACMAFLPSLIPPYPALIVATVIGAFGGGIIEVMGNPIIEACPVRNKNRILSLMHSFYCWGVVLTVLLSTAFFYFVGVENWRLLACIFAAIPALNAFLFCFVPIGRIEAAPADTDKKRSVFRTFTFWALIVLMLCAGAAEQAMSQWASSFAEAGLGVSKTVGDILGPCLFAVLMGIARVFYAKYSEKMNLSKFMFLSAMLCVVSYLIAALSPLPMLSLLGCALCGFAVGIMWPGTICMASERIRDGGVKMFALLALAGDAGCTLGPTAAGWIAEAAGNDLKVSFLVSIIFPALIMLFLVLLALKSKRTQIPKGMK